MERESQLQTKIQAYLRERGGYTVNVVRASRSGVPDILACVEGKFIGIEVKVGTNKSTLLQEHNAKQIEKAGGIAVVIRSMAEMRDFLGDE